MRALLARARLHWVAEALLSARLGHRWTDKWRLGTFHTRLALSRLPRVRPPKPVTAGLKPDGHRVTLATGGELAVLHDILIDEEYLPSGTPQVILDLGANSGLATLFFHRRFPDARIVAVEADPQTFERLRGNVGHLPGVTLVHAAITGRDAPVRFFSSAESIGSSMVAGRGGSTEVEVEGLTIRTLMRREGLEAVDLLKVDIEGAELDALRAAPLDRVAELIAEIHFDLIDAGEHEVRELLASFDVRFSPLGHPQRALLFATRV